MKKLNLVLALLLTPFFLLNFKVFADTVEPKTEVLISCLHYGGTVLGSAEGDDFADCKIVFESFHRDGDFATISGSDLFCEELGAEWTGNNYEITYKTKPYAGSTCSVFGTSSNRFKIGGQVVSKLCPPDNNLDYIHGVDIDENNEPQLCSNVNPALETCPQGFHEFKLSVGCVPITCDDSGSVSTMWSSSSTYNNTTGTYCDGSCAHSVSGGQNSEGYEGRFGITGVATGEICGQGGTEDRWHNEGNGDDCVSVDGFLSCPNGDNSTAPPDTTPTVDLESEEVTLQEITPLIPVEEICVTGDPSCEIRNLKETIVTKGLEQKEIDLILHNKKIAADEKTTTKIIDGINDSTGRNLQGLEMLTTAIDGLKGELGSGGGASGDGFGDGDVTCVDDDCEGGIQTDIEPTAGLEGYWVSEYQDGLQGIMDDQLIDIKDSEFFKFLDQFNPSISGGFAPTYQMCFNIGSLGNFGCHGFNIDPRTFPAIRIFILVSAGFLCRRILFGG